MKFQFCFLWPSIALATTLTAGPVAAQTATGQAASASVTVRFSAEVNGQPFECGKSYADVGSTKASITPSDLRLYVSEVALLDSRGEAVRLTLEQDAIWQFEDIVFLDFENGSGPCRNGTSGVNTSIRGTVPAGDYKGLVFTVGVPFGRNHGDPTQAVAPLNTTAMFWSWQGGYRFIKFDASSKTGVASSTESGARDDPDSVAAAGFSMHLGSTQCASTSGTSPPSACKNPNRMALKFADFDPAKGVVVIDVGRVLAATNVTVNARRTSPGCMSFEKDADCTAVMGALGLPYDGRAAPGPQRLFSAR